MVEGLMKISKDILIVPAHCMTPWFGVFGSKSGFDSMEECFKDQTKHIFALETGMSADPAMLWRLSALDKYALVSNSDSHSANIAKLGRECNVLELPEASYKGIINAIRTHNPDKFLFTVEVDPGFGKYHWDGHRNCKVEFEPQVSIKHGNICPVCKRKLTIGVEHRIEDLADRPVGFKLKGAVPFKRLLPLVEVIAGVMGIQQALSPKVMRTAFELIERFGTEIRILLEIPVQQLAQHVDAKIAAAIIRNRNGEIPVQPGYDGVFGKPLFDASEQIKRTRSPQKTLERYI
jgi:uncharacterized protein (TIGR00375 family)